METIIVSGDISTGKPSSIINTLYNHLHTPVSVFNGVLPDSIQGFDLVIWSPDVSNKEEKSYPVKDKGAVLICSKVIRENRTEVDAVSRIFRMHGNAVICIYKDNPKKMRFRLIDALGNTWTDTDEIKLLAGGITDFFHWSKGQIRVSYVKSSATTPAGLQLPARLVSLNTKVADKVEAGLDVRYFGNFSTRCMKLFPSMRLKADNLYMFSPRNVDKRRITQRDFVLISPPFYYGDRKYSVDAPCQIQLYQQFSDINFMIHGHAHIDIPGYLEAAETECYYPCGDLREVEEIAKIFRTGVRAINLKNHGFLLATENIGSMSKLIKVLNFNPNGILKETQK